MKKIISLLMAVIFVFSMATPTFAAVSANEAAQVNAVSVNDASSTNDIFGDIVDTLNRVINSIINFFKNLFGLNDEVGEYKITYYQDDSKTVVLYEDKCAEGAEIGTVKVPTLPGKTFKGWKPPLPSEMPAEDIEVYATWSDKTYTLVFNTGAIGVDVKSIDALYNSKVTLPTPTVDNYQLLKWEDSYGNRYNPGATITVTSDMSFIAVWSGKITTITFDPAGGYWADGSYGNYNITKPVGTAVEQPANPTRPGYDFIGWNGVVPQKQPVDNITFTAKWSAKTIKTTWVVDGVVKDTQTGKCGDDLSPNVIVTADKGYTFSGWKSSYDNTVYAVSDFPIATPAENTTFTAVFTANEYSYKFVDTDGTTLASGIAKCGASLKAPVIANATGCTFGGWKLSTNGSTVNDAYVTMPASNVTFTVIQTPNTYNIVWDVDGVKTTTPAAYGSEIVKPADPKKAGYVFNGWAGYTAGMTVPVDGITFTATWANSTDTKYVVEIYKMDTTGAYVKDSALTETKYGTTGAAVATGHADIEGFTFNESKSVLSGTIAADGSTALKVYYDRNKYTVTVNGTAQEYYYGATIKAPAAATQEGCTFAGWRGSDGKLYAAGADVTVPANDGFTLTPEFTPNNYTITFNVNGAEYQKLTFAYGADIIAPADPTMADMYFEGWSPALPTTMPANNLTVTAVFSAVTTHKVTFHANGGTFVIEDADGETTTTVTNSFNVNRGQKIPCPDAPTAPKGNRFIGWAEHKEGTYTAEDVLFTGIEDSIKMTYNKDIYFYAVYVTPTCDVTYIVDGVELEVAEADSVVKLGETVTPSKINPKDKQGYTFSGWSIKSINGEVQKVDENGKLPVAVDFTVEDEDVSIVYVGELVANKHDVIYHTASENGAWADATAADGKAYEKKLEATYDAQIPMPEAPVPVYGKVFLGWAEEEGSDKLVDIGVLTKPEPETNPETGETKTYYNANDVYHYYAVYANRFYKVKFVEYDKKLGTETVEFGKIFNYGDALDISSATHEAKDGYVQNEENGYKPTVPAVINQESIAELTKLGVVSSESATYTYPDNVTSSDYNITVFTFEVQYEPRYYKLYFVNCGYQPKDVPCDGILSQYITNPTSDGRTFSHWSTDAAGKDVLELADAVGNPATMPAKTLTLYANWTENQYTIKFISHKDDAGKDVVVKTIAQDYETAITAPENPTRPGYTFAGWDTEIPKTMPSKDMVITAKWTTNKYTITFDTNGGLPKTVAPVTQEFGTTVELPVVTKTGHTFLGWSKSGDTIDIAADVKYVSMPVDGMKLTAKWKANVYKIEFDTKGGTPIDTIEDPYGTPVSVSTERDEYHVLEGWYDQDGNFTETVTTTVPDKNMKYTAKWKCVNHTIYFHFVEIPEDKAETPDKDERLDDKNMIAREFACDELIVTPTEADLAAKGFTVPTAKVIAGWKGEDGNAIAENMANDNSMIGNHYVVSGWDNAKYTVAFVDTDGTEIKTLTDYIWKQKILNADVPVPTKEGHIFEGWIGEDGNLVDFSKDTVTMPAKNVTYKASWSKDSFKVTWVVDGKKTEETYEFGATIKKPADPSKEGYTFTGWTPEVSATMGAEDVVYTATFSVNTYVATFDPNDGLFMNADGTTSDKAIEMEFAYGTTISFPSNVSRTGYDYSGWVDSKDDTTRYTTMPAKDVVFNAVWVAADAITYTVKTYTMDTAGEYGEPETLTLKGTTGETVTYEPASIEGFTVAANSVKTGAVKADGSLVLTVYYERNQYDIEYVVDGKVKESVKVYYDAMVTAQPVPADTNDTDYPVDWSWTWTSKDADGNPVVNNTMPSNMPATKVTASVVSKPMLYTVTVIGAETGYNHPKVEYKTLLNESDLVKPNVEGMAFVEWRDLEDKAIVFPLEITENTSIVAYCEAEKYNVAFYDSDPATGTQTTLLTTKQVTYGDVISYVPPTTPEGYVFEGWLSNGKIQETVPADATVLIAKWKPAK